MVDIHKVQMLDGRPRIEICEDVSLPPGIDRLLRIADIEQDIRLPKQRFEDVVLLAVSVLELIDEYGIIRMS